MTDKNTAGVDLDSVKNLPRPDLRHHDEFRRGYSAAIDDVLNLARRAEPSVAAVDERADFEREVLRLDIVDDEGTWAGANSPDGWYYFDDVVNACWKTWQARAALASPSVSQQAAPAATLTKEEIHTLRRLIECAEALDKRPRPLCRDCADEDGTCPNGDKLECDMGKLFADAKRLHDKLATPATTASASGDAASNWVGEPPAEWPPVTDQEKEDRDAAVKFYQSNPSAALWDFKTRIESGRLRFGRAQAPSLEAAPTIDGLPRYKLVSGKDREWMTPAPDGAWCMYDHAVAVIAQQGASHAANAGEDTERDTARLDWLNQNFFSDQKDEWDERLAPDSIKWKFFGPMSVQGDIRRVIDAAIASSAAQEAK